MIYWFIHRLLIHYTQWTTSATAAHAAAADDTHDAAVPCEEIISRYVMPCFFAVRKFLYPSAEMSRTGGWLGGRLGGRLGEWLARRFGERGEWFALSDVLVLEPPVKDGTLLLELPVKEQPELRAHR